MLEIWASSSYDAEVSLTVSLLVNCSLQVVMLSCSSPAPGLGTPLDQRPIVHSDISTPHETMSPLPGLQSYRS